MDWLRRPSGLLVPPEPRIHLPRYCDLFGGSMMVGSQLPDNVSSQATTLQSFTVGAFCTMEAKGWGAGGGKFDPFNPSSPRGGGGAFAHGLFALNPGDVVTYSSGGPGLPAIGENPPVPGTSGSGLRNGGNGSGPGGGATEIWINDTLVMVVAGGGGAADTNGGPGGDANGRNGADFDFTQLGGRGATSTAPGDGGSAAGTLGGSGLPGVGGKGGDGGGTGPGITPGGGGGGGLFGGGGGAGSVSSAPTGGGSGSSHLTGHLAGSGTLTAATDWRAANQSDPDRPGAAGDAEQPGGIVLKFTAA